MTNTSVYIPHIFANQTADYIAHCFEYYDIGVVDHVDIVPKANSKAFQAFVHFQQWSDNPAAQNIKNKIEAGQQAALNYSDPWYWNLLKNKNPESIDDDSNKDKIENMIKKIEELQKRVTTLEKDDDILAQRIKHNKKRRYVLEDIVYDEVDPKIDNVLERLYEIERRQLELLLNMPMDKNTKWKKGPCPRDPITDEYDWNKVNQSAFVHSTSPNVQAPFSKPTLSRHITNPSSSDHDDYVLPDLEAPHEHSTDWRPRPPSLVRQSANTQSSVCDDYRLPDLDCPEEYRAEMVYSWRNQNLPVHRQRTPSPVELRVSNSRELCDN